MTFKDYLADSRRFTLSLLVIAPILALYEFGIFLAEPGIRNGADVSFRRIFALLGPHGQFIWCGLLLVSILVCAFCLYRENIAAHYYFLPVLAEGFVYSLVFGPVVLLLQDSLGPQGLSLREYFASAAPQQNSATLNFILAIGAGVYEEALFRLVLLSVLYYLGKKLCEFLAVPTWVAALAAVGLSSLAFSAFHHLGEFASPFSWGAFAFRSFAGAVLGAIFILRGFGVAVYTHAFYDILYLLTFAKAA